MKCSIDCIYLFCLMLIELVGGHSDKIGIYCTIQNNVTKEGDPTTKKFGHVTIKVIRNQSVASIDINPIMNGIC